MKAVLNRDFSPNYSLYRVSVDRDRSGLFYKIIFTGYEEDGKNHYLKRSEHDSYMFTFCIKGHGYIKYHNKVHEFQKDDLLFINCMDEHEMWTDKDGMTLIYIHLQNPSLEAFLAYVQNITGIVISCPNDSIGFVSTIKGIHKTIEEKKFDECDASIKIYEMLLRLRKHVHDMSTYIAFAPETIRKATEYIEDHFTARLSLDEIAQEVGLSKYYLEKKFKECLGVPVSQYIAKKRITKAQELLIQTDLSVSEISSEVGLLDSQVLIRMFKKNLGITPYQYRIKSRIIY